jgi:hypothetical protein
MSLEHRGRWHYERLKRGSVHVYRVGDEDDDPVITVHNEHEAIRIVRQHNARLDATRPPGWKD